MERTPTIAPRRCPMSARMSLSDDQVAALRNLAHKKAGDEVGWIAIEAAQQLTSLGLAIRNPSGWQITAAGEAVLALESETDQDDNTIVALVRPHPGESKS